MNENTKIKYTFHNKEGEVVEMIFTILQIEGMIGGFMDYVQNELDAMEFGKPTEIYRILEIS